MLGPQHEAEIAANFDRVYQQLYGRSLPGVAIEGITWRLTALGSPTAARQGSAQQQAGANEATHPQPRAIYLPELGDFAQVPVYSRYALSPHSTFDGPAVIEERESTVVMGAQSRADIDAFGNLSVILHGNG
jgi:N-methylhydantoinase A